MPDYDRSKPPAELVAKSSSYINKLIAAADVKKGLLGRPLSTSMLTFHLVPPKVKGKKGRQEVIKPLSGLDIESLLVKHKPEHISKENAIPEFRQILTSAHTDEVIFEAVNEMSEIIRDLLQGTGDVNYQRAQENIKVMREAMVDFEFPEIYNDFIRDLKKRIFKKEFGNQSEFWQNLKHERLGLIDTNTLPVAEVSPEEAKEVHDPPLLQTYVGLIDFSSSIPWQLNCLLGHETIKTRLCRSLWYEKLCFHTLITESLVINSVGAFQPNVSDSGACRIRMVAGALHA